MKIKNIFKKNQVIAGTIALMLIAAGYMNYSLSTKGELSSLQVVDSKEYADLGDATLVSGNVTQESNNDNENKEESKTKETSENLKVKENNQADQYFSKSRLDRDTMYSQMIESYQNILNNNQLTPDQKNAAGREIEDINRKKNAIMISENLIKNKGFEDVIIFVNNQSVDVIVKAKELNEEQVSQIVNIVERELSVEASDIHISNKE